MVMKKVRIADLKSRLSEYLLAVSRGDTIAVVDGQVPVTDLADTAGECVARSRAGARHSHSEQDSAAQASKSENRYRATTSRREKPVIHRPRRRSSKLSGTCKQCRSRNVKSKDAG
jgi:antitoxin (DNA-binding transcriptional repressor) of toxin-antitoxin stability system